MLTLTIIDEQEGNVTIPIEKVDFQVTSLGFFGTVSFDTSQYSQYQTSLNKYLYSEIPDKPTYQLQICNNNTVLYTVEIYGFQEISTRYYTDAGGNLIHTIVGNLYLVQEQNE